jgi:hypothetical protein
MLNNNKIYARVQAVKKEISKENTLKRPRNIADGVIICGKMLSFQMNL